MPSRRKPRVLFFAWEKNFEHLNSINHYTQDIKAISNLDCTLTVLHTPFDFRILCRYDIYFIWWWTWALPIILISRFYRARSYVTGTYNITNQTSHAYKLFYSRNLKYIVKSYLCFLAARLATMNLLVSSVEQRLLEARHSNILYYPHVVDNPRNIYANKTDNTIDILNIAWSGSTNLVRKNIFGIIDAFCISHNKHPNLRLTLMGIKGDGYCKLLAKIKSLSCRDSIYIISDASPNLKDDVLRNCDIYIQPSYYEGFGLAILEAMSYGKPVIVSDVGEISTVVRTCGIYVDPTSLDDISNAINILCSSKPIREYYGWLALNQSYLFSSKSKVKFLADLFNIKPIPNLQMKQ